MSRLVTYLLYQYINILGAFYNKILRKDCTKGKLKSNIFQHKVSTVSKLTIPKYTVLRTQCWVLSGAERCWE